jgi:hypothetical protein
MGKGQVEREPNISTSDIFLIKDRIDHGEITVEYCPTDAMIADIFTKPLQGKSFNIFQDVILNCENDASPNKEHRSVLGVCE